MVAYFCAYCYNDSDRYIRVDIISEGSCFAVEKKRFAVRTPTAAVPFLCLFFIVPLAFVPGGLLDMPRAEVLVLYVRPVALVLLGFAIGSLIRPANLPDHWALALPGLVPIAAYLGALGNYELGNTHAMGYWTGAVWLLLVLSGLLLCYAWHSMCTAAHEDE